MGGGKIREAFIQKSLEWGLLAGWVRSKLSRQGLRSWGQQCSFRTCEGPFGSSNDPPSLLTRGFGCPGEDTECLDSREPLKRVIRRKMCLESERNNGNSAGRGGEGAARLERRRFELRMWQQGGKVKDAKAT